MGFEREKKKVAKLSVYSNSFLVISKLLIGFITGSISVISEALHSGLDLLASFIAFYAVKNSSKPADRHHQFGHGKIENLSGFIEAILIFLAGLWIIYESVKKLIKPAKIESIELGIIIMFISSFVNFLIARKLFKTSKKTGSIALKADAMHLMTDVYTSAGVMFSLFLIWFGGVLFKGRNFYFLDPLVALIIAFIIIKASYELIKESTSDLIDTSLSASDLDGIRDVISSSKNIISFKNLRTRKSGNIRFIEFDVVFDENISLKDAHNEADNISKNIKKRFDDAEVIIHMEPCTRDCTDQCLLNCVEKLDRSK
jgi:cation diffusion facilitator family transporter